MFGGRYATVALSDSRFAKNVETNDAAQYLNRQEDTKIWALPGLPPFAPKSLTGPKVSA